MIDDFYSKRQDESEDAYLIRLGDLKKSKQINLTWDEFADIMNSFQKSKTHDESYYRKKYYRLIESLSEDKDTEEEEEENNNTNDNIKQLFKEIEKERIRTRDERNSLNRIVRSQAREEAILELFKEEISKYKNIKPVISNQNNRNQEASIYVMLSDIHYGLSFHSIGGIYNSDIAKQRIYHYAAAIKSIGKHCKDCYVSLMGDMISGVIHNTIRLENKETIIEQVVGVSELIANFLLDLSFYFEHVYINSVDGNHSRIDQSMEDALRGEKLDSLIPWYCKAKLQDIDNIKFIDNKIDTTIGSFIIYDKLYVSVHGDMEKDLKTSAQNIEKSIGKHIDYMLAAHTHVPSIRQEDTTYIHNGCVCGSGDDYTMKKRLFGPASQVCMICTKNGIESIHPVTL